MRHDVSSVFFDLFLNLQNTLCARRTRVFRRRGPGPPPLEPRLGRHVRARGRPRRTHTHPPRPGAGRPRHRVLQDQAERSDFFKKSFFYFFGGAFGNLRVCISDYYFFPSSKTRRYLHPLRQEQVFAQSQVSIFFILDSNLTFLKVGRIVMSGNLP